MSDLFSISGTKVLFTSANKCLLESGYHESIATLRFVGEDSEYELYNFAKIFKMLETAGVSTYFQKQLNLHECQVSTIQLFPVTCSLRAVANNEFAEKFGVKPGSKIGDTIMEWQFHSEVLSNPQITLDHIRAFSIVENEELKIVQQVAQKVFQLMTGFFISYDLLLGSVKLRFGKDNWGRVLLAEEIGPSQMELWSVSDFRQVKQSHQKLYRMLSGKES